jgi:hypothetical protein
MGFRYQKRIKLGKGFGLNISKSGISPSYRSKSGSVSSKGYSVRTGIPGLTYRKGFRKGGCMLAFVIGLFMLTTMTYISCTPETDDESETLTEWKCGTYNGHVLYTGPKGGCYYYNSNNNKTYVDRSECDC